MNLLPKVETIRKAVVAFIAANAAAIALVTTADWSTWQGVITFVVAELSALGVYVVPNADSNKATYLGYAADPRTAAHDERTYDDPHTLGHSLDPPE